MSFKAISDIADINGPIFSLEEIKEMAIRQRAERRELAVALKRAVKVAAWKDVPEKDQDRVFYRSFDRMLFIAKNDADVTTFNKDASFSRVGEVLTPENIRPCAQSVIFSDNPEWGSFGLRREGDHFTTTSDHLLFNSTLHFCRILVRR